MNNQLWFERRWDFDAIRESYKAICTRLAGAVDRLQTATADIPSDVMVYQPLGKWSIKEHVGHLFVLEPLWRTRLQDILDGRPSLTPADLDNRATTEAGFNDRSIDHLLRAFSEERARTIGLLDSIGEPDNTKKSAHPRLGQSFGIIDLAYFVAEHDDHHLKRIREITGMTG